MTAMPEKPTRQMPKGGRKGGSVFPRVALDDAVSYARKLVGKTHTGPQPQDVIFSGVVGAKSGTGQVRISALKQYGFIAGNVNEKYSADDLAKKIVAAPPEELVPLYRKAILKPTVFKKLFDTFHGDSVSKAKLKQRAAELKVHPDETASCVDLYISGMATAQLVTVEGDLIKHLASSDLAVELSVNGAAEPEMADDEFIETEHGDCEGIELAANPVNKDEKAIGNVGPRAVFNVNVTLDSSLDIEKLQKQLELLKRFGAI